MALVEINAGDDAFDRLFERCVVEHDVGGLATELEGELSIRAGECGGDALAHFGRAGERDLVHARMRDEGGSRFPRAGHDVDDAGWEVGLLQNSRKVQCGERRRFGRLQNAGVAGGESGREFPRSHEEGEIPRDDLAGDADRT